MPEQTPPVSSSTQPSRRDRLRPLELIGFAAVLAIFAGLVVIFTTRDIALTAIFAGVAFIIVLMMVALVGLGGKPTEADNEARKDLKTDGKNWH